MSFSGAVKAPMSTKTGGSAEQVPCGALTRKWNAIGIVYARENGGVVEISILYEAHVPKEIKDELAERFGCGIHQWRVIE